jgi:hypothetical protein
MAVHRPATPAGAAAGAVGAVAGLPIRAGEEAAVTCRPAVVPAAVQGSRTVAFAERTGAEGLRRRAEQDRRQPGPVSRPRSVGHPPLPRAAPRPSPAQHPRQDRLPARRPVVLRRMSEAPARGSALVLVEIPRAQPTVRPGRRHRRAPASVARDPASRLLVAEPAARTAVQPPRCAETRCAQVTLRRVLRCRRSPVHCLSSVPDRVLSAVLIGVRRQTRAAVRSAAAARARQVA